MGMEGILSDTSCVVPNKTYQMNENQRIILLEKYGWYKENGKWVRTTPAVLGGIHFNNWTIKEEPYLMELTDIDFESLLNDGR